MNDYCTCPEPFYNSDHVCYDCHLLSRDRWRYLNEYTEWLDDQRAAQAEADWEDRCLERMFGESQ